MSQAKVLSVAQQHKSISGKYNKKSFKFVLSQPFPHYWPEIQINHFSELQNVIRDYIINKKNEKSVFGIESMLELIKQSKVNAILLSTKLKPHFIIKQIINLALTTNVNIKILIVPDLEELCNEIIGRSTSGISLFKPNEPYEQSLYDCILKLSMKFPIPELIVTKFQNINLQSPMEVDSTADNKMQVEKSCEENIYLIRDSKSKERIFVPPKALNKTALEPIKPKITKSIKNLAISSDVLEIPENVVLFQKKKKKSKSKLKEKQQNIKYISLKVEKVAKNPNKIKKNKKNKKLK